MGRKTLRVLSVLVIVCMMTGCMRFGVTIDTSRSKKQYITVMKTWYNKEKVDSYASGAALPQGFSEMGLDSSYVAAMMAEIQSYPVVTLDGKQYYKGEEQKDKSNYYPKDNSDSMIVTRTSFYVGNAADTINASTGGDTEAVAKYMSDYIEKIDITVRFSEPIKKTNGKLSKNKKSVSFSYGIKKLISGKNTEMYAYTGSSDRSLNQDREDFKKLSKQK